MLFFFQKSHYFFHSIMKLIRRGRRNKRDDGVLVLVTRRITIDDNPAAHRARLVFNLQTLRHEWGRINHKVRHLRLQRSFLGREIAAVGHGLRGGRLLTEVGVFWSS
jgi:hypothetical protein